MKLKTDGNYKKVNRIDEIFQRLEKEKVKGEHSEEKANRELTYPVIKPIRKLVYNSEENYNENKENDKENYSQEVKKKSNQNWLRKLTEEKKMQRSIEKIKRSSSKKIRPKKITLELEEENLNTSHLGENKECELQRIFMKMKNKENSTDMQNKKIITPKKNTPHKKRLGKNPELKTRSVKDLIKRYDRDKPI